MSNLYWLFHAPLLLWLQLLWVPLIGVTWVLCALWEHYHPPERRDDEPPRYYIPE